MKSRIIRFFNLFGFPLNLLIGKYLDFNTMANYFKNLKK